MNKFTISKEFSFSASHQLDGLPKDHQCSRLHGHNYKLIVVLQGEVNEIGFIRDYGDLKVIETLLAENIDHRHLNNVVNFNPTAELLAKWFYEELKPHIKELSSIIIKETDKTSAEYTNS